MKAAMMIESLWMLAGTQKDVSVHVIVLLCTVLVCSCHFSSTILVTDTVLPALVNIKIYAHVTNPELADLSF